MHVLGEYTGGCPPHPRGKGGRGLCPHGDGPLVTQLAAVVAPSDSPTGIVAETRPKCRTVG